MKTLLIALLASVSMTLSLSASELKLPGVFSEHMVLQRDMAVPVWGEAKPGEKITVKFRSQEKTAVADDKGKWQVKLDPLTAGGPDKLIVVGDKTIEIDDVLVGEVWVGSGQSNMAICFGGAAKNDPVLAADLAAAPYPKVRQFRVNQSWKVATATNLVEDLTNPYGGFSALLFAFGLRLHKELGVPVGLMVGAAGGTPSGFWLSEEALKADAACQASIAKYSPPPPPGTVKPGEAVGGKVGWLYNIFIRPLIPYGIRGVLWDQGEEGTGIVGVDDQYTLMGALISGWRREWGQNAFPFIYVQKPSGGGCGWDPMMEMIQIGGFYKEQPDNLPDEKWEIGPGVRVDTNIKIMTYPNVGMAISSDLGSGLHPANKSGYGHRAADVALGMVYGKKLEYYGPVYASHKMEGGQVRVSFTHIGQGLAFQRGPKLQGFVIAGPDKVFHKADAKIEGETVVLSSAAVSQPVAVRYGWAIQRPWANLFNKDGLPAIPFRTDQ